MKIIALFITLLLPICTWAAAEKTVNPRVEQTIRTSLSDMSIKTVRATPIPGLYELQIDKNTIYYADKTGRHLITGHLFDTRNKVDITGKRLAELSRINWKELPLKNAIVSGPKRGARIAVFTDPDCPYCKQLEEVLSKTKGLRVYTLLFPLTSLHPDSFAKSESIWCSKNQHKAMVDVMLKGKTLPKASCKTPIKNIMAAGGKFNVRGTPTIFAEDGSKYAGPLNVKSIEAWAKKGS